MEEYLTIVHLELENPCWIWSKLRSSLINSKLSWVAKMEIKIDLVLVQCSVCRKTKKKILTRSCSTKVSEKFFLKIRQEEKYPLLFLQTEGNFFYLAKLNNKGSKDIKYKKVLHDWPANLWRNYIHFSYRFNYILNMNYAAKTVVNCNISFHKYDI